MGDGTAVKDCGFQAFPVGATRRTVGVVAEFVLEFYASRTDTAAVKRRAQRARLAADALTREGTPVRFVRSIYVPDDETCFVLYEAASCDAVRKAAARADLSFQRVARALAN